MDPPGARTSHARSTPTSGGIAVVAAACVGFALVARGPAPDVHIAVAAAAWALALAVIGAVDDLLDLPARLKLALMAAAAAGCALAVTPASGLAPALALIAAGVAAAWLVLATNAVNFMDGANGLAAGCTALALAALAFAARGTGAGEMALAAAAAAAGFLPWNLAGRLFQGDAGALFLGFLFAGLSVAAADRVGPLFGPTCLLPLLVDVLLTLARRARARRPLMQAHREHLYQRWLQSTGRPHAGLAWRAWTLTAACCALALATARAGLGFQGISFAMAAVLLTAGWTWLSRRVDGALRLGPARGDDRGQATLER